MKKIAAFIVFLVLISSVCLAVDLSIVPGLSAKNLLLYLLVVWIAFDAVLNSRRGGLLHQQIDYMTLHGAFIVLIVLAVLSAATCVFVLQYDKYWPLYAIISLKASLFDNYLMLFVFLAAIRDSREAIWMAKAILILMTIAMTLSLIEMFDFMQLGIMDPRADGRLQGPLLGSNEYGALMAFYLPTAFVFAYLARGKWRALWIFSGFVYLMVMVFSASRGAVVGLFGGAFVGVMLFRRYISARALVQSFIAVAIVGAIAVALLAIQHGDLLYTRYIETTIATNIYDQSSGRTEIWAAALSLMSAEPVTFLVGFGWATFDLMNEWGSHNEYLRYIFELGLIGLSFLLFIYFAVLYEVRSAARYVSADARLILIGFACGYLSIIVSTLFNHMSAPWLFVWGQTGLMLRFACSERALAGSDQNRGQSPEASVPSLRHGKNRVAQADL